LFNDRYGLHRIYYQETDAGVFFASEAKALLKVLPELRSLDPRSVGEYLVYDCVLENRTFFRAVFLLPPGSVWEFKVVWSGNGSTSRRNLLKVASCYLGQSFLRSCPKRSFEYCLAIFTAA